MGAHKSDSHERNGEAVLPPAHSPMLPAHSLSWGRMFISSIRRSIVLCSGSTCSSPGSHTIPRCRVGGRCSSFEFSPRSQVRGGGTPCEGQTSGDAGWNNNHFCLFGAMLSSAWVPHYVIYTCSCTPESCSLVREKWQKTIRQNRIKHPNVRILDGRVQKVCYY